MQWDTGPVISFAGIDISSCKRMNIKSNAKPQLTN